MKYSVATLSAFVAAVLAQQGTPLFLNSAINPQEGVPFTLQISGCDALPCEIVLQSGPSGNLQTLETLASGVTGTSVTVTLTNVNSGQYNFGISSDGGTLMNFSQMFSYTGTGSISFSGTAAASATATASASGASMSASATTTNGSLPASAFANMSAMSTTLSTVSVSASMSSLTSNATTTTSSASISSSSSSSASSTSSSASRTVSASSTTNSSSSALQSVSASTVPNSVDRVSSPLALVAGVALAIVFLS